MRSSRSLRNISLYFVKLGSTGFGGPVALVSAMQRDLVENTNWFTQEEFQKGIILSKMAPGPLAAQMAFYFGWLERRWLGALLTGVCFVLPSFLIVVILSILYLRYGMLPGIRGALLGVTPMALAIVILGARKLAVGNLKRDWALWFIAAVNAVFTLVLHQESVGVLLISGTLFLAIKEWKTWSRSSKLNSVFPLYLLKGLHGEASLDQIANMFLYFLKSGALVFGGGLAIVPFLRGGVVSEFHWLTETQFVDAIAIAMVTPGPILIVVAFIGYLVAGLMGSTVATVGVFAPCYILTVLLAPFYEAWASRPRVMNFIYGLTAGAIGAVFGAIGILSIGSLQSWSAIGIFLVGLVLLLKTKIPEPVLILSAGIFGLVVFRILA